MAVLEKALIASLLIGVAIYSLGILGQSIAEHMNVLTEKFDKGSTEDPPADHPSAGTNPWDDPPNASQAYYNAKQALQNFADDQENILLERLDELINLLNLLENNVINPRRNYSLTDVEAENLTFRFIDMIVGDPPNASDKYYEYKEEAFRIYNSGDSNINKLGALKTISDSVFGYDITLEESHIFLITVSLGFLCDARIYHPFLRDYNR